jgi:hypothetical protein
MCLRYANGSNCRFKAETKNQQEITVYKILRKDFDGSGNEIYVSPIMKNRQRWKIGINKSNLNWFTRLWYKIWILICDLDGNSYIDLYKGIHVFTASYAAYNFLRLRFSTNTRLNCIIVSCKANMKDFVAYDSFSKEAIFTKVSLDSFNNVMEEEINV